ALGRFVLFEIPAVPVPLGQDLARCVELGVRWLRDAERLAELVDDALVRRGDASADCFVANFPRAVPVGIEITAGQPRARLRVREALAGEGDDGVVARRVVERRPSTRPRASVPSLHARTQTRLRSPGSCARMSSLSTSDSCSFSAAKTASTARSVVARSGRPASLFTRSRKS